GDRSKDELHFSSNLRASRCGRVAREAQPRANCIRTRVLGGRRKKTPTKNPRCIRGTLKCPTGYAAPPTFLPPQNPRSRSSTYILRSEQAKSNAKKGTPRATLPLRFT